MLFDRYRKAKRPDDAVRPLPAKPSNLAAALFRALTKKAWYTEKQRQDSGVDLTPPPAPPRQSASLPNIASYDVSNVEMTTTPPTPSSPSLPVLESPTPKPTISTPAATRSRAPFPAPDTTHSRAASKRHSAEHRVTASLDDQRMKRVKRHSFTYGRIHDDLGRLKVSDEPSTSATTTVEVAPKRSQSQQLPVNRLQPRVHGRQQQQQQQSGTPLSAERLAEMLAMDSESMLLIDVRNILEYQRRRIDGSFNVNLPSLLIKRYQRGTVSNFNLENFITTTEGRARYVEKRGSNPNRKLTWVVYDDDMLLERTSQAWTLLGVLERAMDNDHVFYLQGGFNGFHAHDTYLVDGCSDDDDDDMGHGGSPDVDTVLLDDNSNRKSVQFPRRSVSYTLGSTHDKTHLHRRTSLFSLDTQAARANNANALARRANKRAASSSSNSIHNDVTSNNNNNDFLLPAPQQLLVAPSATTSTASSLARVVEDDDEEATIPPITSPRTETDFEFVISEIIPGFLFVGPEIETADHAEQLQQRHIRRVLNMAEECSDDIIRNSNAIVYRKISARDTVEMKNIDWVMMEAVCFIEDAKRHHEPIYVHCKAGKSRSVTAILAYLVSSERWTLKQAYRHVIKARPNMSPNIGFIAELMKMEGRVHGRVSSFMETDWQSSSMPSPEFTRELKELELAWQQTPCEPVPSIALK
ncbi:hypothetical protein O0I10_010233 [Lichtheimia ornata]|uniref:protein-tyrosine-phosphatase n=1 Tax=Lichtheimia ornata TaxID=688661 RepID=A0AAD7XY20_9FUNG|nr:uncharacterized protein O0I10_010233 [Lichtheimia ornata]KAJ8654157.1 hypothetical protein O0I10_010233 [Lichtheimia ornata]